MLTGESVPDGSIEAPDPVSIPVARRGLHGRVGDREFVACRPRFGLRLANRSVELRGDAPKWASRMFSYRHFSITEIEGGKILYEQRSKAEQVHERLTNDELVMVLLFAHCGVIQGSSLVNAITI